METNGNDPARDICLRVVFDDTVLTLGLSANATFEDLARKLGKLSKRRYGDPVGIYVTLGRDSQAPVAQ